MSLRILTNPTQEPISLAEAYHQLKIDFELDSDGLIVEHPEDKQLIELMISSARADCENFCGVSFAVKKYELSLDNFPFFVFESCPIELPFGPISYIESFMFGATSLTSSSYEVDYSSGCLIPVGSWPTINSKKGNLKIVYWAGHGEETSETPEITPVPPEAKIAILMLLSHLNENREAVTEKQMHELPMGVQSFLRPLKKTTGLS